MEKIYCDNLPKPSGPVTDADVIPLKVSEIKKVSHFRFILCEVKIHEQI